MQQKVLLRSLTIVLSLIFVLSCNKDYYSVGIEIFDQQFDDLKTKTFPVFSYQEFERVISTNKKKVA